MASNRNSWEKRERDKAKRARAAAKRERRLAGPDPDEAEGAGAAAADPAAVMEQLAQLHQVFDDGGMEFDEFEERKAELLAQLSVD